MDRLLREEGAIGLGRGHLGREPFTDPGGTFRGGHTLRPRHIIRPHLLIMEKRTGRSRGNIRPPHPRINLNRGLFSEGGDVLALGTDTLQQLTEEDGDSSPIFEM